jgi:opacity protein-like surface antigen
VSGLAGFSFGGSSSFLVGAEGGVYITPTIAIYGSFGRMSDTTPGEVKDVFDMIGDEFGTDVTIKSPTVFGVAGVKVFLPMPAARPYAVAGIGAARVSPKIEEDDQDVTDIFEDVAGFELSESGRVIEFGAGVEIPRGKLLIDLGYRFMHLGEDYNTSRIYGAVGVRF